MGDRNSDPIRAPIPAGYMWRGQLPHALLLAALLPGVWALAAPVVSDDVMWAGLSERDWLIAAIAVPVLHQVTVALLWRAQLCHALLTRLFGDAGFVVWGIIFFPMLFARPITAIGLAIADTGSLPVPPWLGVSAGVLLFVPTLWAMHSVVKYFGFPRALGGDHFFERYRAMPMVRGGAFKWSSNAMYAFIFLGLWGIALIGRSQAALALALFQHAYIWVHWYCTEQPDGVVLYGTSPDTDPQP